MSEAVAEPAGADIGEQTQIGPTAEISKRLAEKMQKHMDEIPKKEEPSPVPTPPATPKQEPAVAPKLTETKKEPTVAPEADELPESIKKSPKASEEFKKIRDIAKRNQSEAEKQSALVKTLESQLAEVKTAQAKPQQLSTAELDALKKANEELTSQLKLVAIERLPEFRSHFDGRMNAAVEQAKAAVGPEVADKVAKLMRSPDTEYRTEQLDKIIEQVEETSASKGAILRGLVKDIHTINFEREAALKKANEDYAHVEKHRAETAKKQEELSKAETIKRRDALIQSALTKSKDLEAFKRIEGNTEHNNEVAEREGFVKSFLSGDLNDDVLPYVPVLASEAIYLREKILPALQEENAKLNKQIKEMSGASPRPSAGAPASEAPLSTTPGRSFIERFKANNPSK